MVRPTKKIRRKALAIHRRLRSIRMIAKGLISTRHPLLVHIIPTRRCNLACTYCNEFDDVSKPVPTEEMFRRIDRLGEMGTAIVTISGGEPLLHPEPDEVSKKSLKVLDRKLELLAEHADFQVNINSVVGSEVRNPEDALTIARR